MLAPYLTGLLLLTAVLVLWVWVQGAWRRTFPEACRDPDVLAARPGCHSCEHADACEPRLARAGSDVEERT